MRRNTRFCVIGLCATLISCSAPPPPPAEEPKPAEPVSNEPAFVVAGFDALEEGTVDKSLPFLTTDGGRPTEERCLVRDKESIQWDTTNPDVIASIQAKVLPIKAGILRWVESTLASDAPDAGIGSWQVDIDELTVRHLGGEKVRLKETQGCFTAESMILPAGSKVVTTLFGAKKIILRSNTEIPRPLVKKMKKRGKKQNIYLSTVLTYKKAMDADGKLIRGKKGQPMHQAPDGSLVPPKKVPPPAKRPVFELIIKVPRAVNFAYGWMPTSHWKMENTKGNCDLNLIYDDLTPRVPECAQLTNIGFGISEGKDVMKEIVIKVSADNTTAQKTVAFGTTELIQAGGRYLAWVTPRKEELGAILEIDAIVLNGSTETEELVPFRFGK